MNTLICFVLLKDKMVSCRLCLGTVWNPPASLNCSNLDCPLVEAVEEYARHNLVKIYIFFKV